jgi:hypothetical protein
MSTHQEEEIKNNDEERRETLAETLREAPPARGNSDEIVAGQTRDVTADPSKPE